MYIYLFVFSRFMGTADDVEQLLDRIDEIEDYRRLFSNCFLIRSDESASVLHQRIKESAPNRRFLISEVSSNRQGWLPRRLWEFIHHEYNH